MGYIKRVQTVVETDHYLSRAAKRLTAEERRAVIDLLASDPQAGDVIKGTGGIRKVRFATEGKGKSGSVRVIYFYFSEGAPLYLFTVFAKNEKADLSAKERAALAKVAKAIKQAHRGK